MGRSVLRPYNIVPRRDEKAPCQDAAEKRRQDAGATGDDNSPIQ